MRGPGSSQRTPQRPTSHSLRSKSKSSGGLSELASSTSVATLLARRECHVRECPVPETSRRPRLTRGSNASATASSERAKRRATSAQLRCGLGAIATARASRTVAILASWLMPETSARISPERGWEIRAPVASMAGRKRRISCCLRSTRQDPDRPAHETAGGGADPRSGRPTTGRSGAAPASASRRGHR